MDAGQFCADVEGGIVPIVSHEDLMRLGFVYAVDAIERWGNVFTTTDKIHSLGFTFGEDELRFNRTLDVFHFTQLMAALYREDPLLESDTPSFSDFPTFYQKHYDILGPSVWRSYYSLSFLTQKATTRFYRPPDLRDLPGSSYPLFEDRQPMPEDLLAEPSQLLRIPRWAFTVVCTRAKQQFLPSTTITALALTTLEATINSLHRDYPRVQPYSEPLARYWLDQVVPAFGPGPCAFGELVAMGFWNIHWLSGRYVAQVTGQEFTQPEKKYWYTWPDGGTDACAAYRGWKEEIGSEEEVQFLAAVACQETAGLSDKESALGEFDLSVRSHILLAIMQATVKDQAARAEFLDDLEERMVRASIIESERVKLWMSEVSKIMESYTHEWQGKWPGSGKGESTLRRILVENPQLFAFWNYSWCSKQFYFELARRKDD
ncbi:Uncharacterized protein PECH_001715 [Penicillium ucsense]|uniref:Uncharacterized protein n=1 Tax=Penicillium ucsense TaxID=2839758 RepID=A0A8J8WE77_9EURO|nr:Uncharacterized protein PECM_001531 [Penicillium ucsense]KAF7732421.1 Uncharacterized protein PECH_001715 [Penicillium ucsense]